MITKQQKFRLGVFLVVSIVLLTSIFAVFVIPKLKSRGDLYYINFKGMSVNGVNKGAAVKYQGVSIGKVMDLEVNAEDLDSIIITVKIRTGFPVKEDMGAALTYAGITGLKFIEISGGSLKSKTVEPGGWILASRGLGEKAEDIVLNVDSVVSALNDLLNPENRKRITNIIANLEKTTGVVSNILEKRENKIISSLDKLDKTLENVNKVTAKMDRFMDMLNGEMENLKLGKISDDTLAVLKALKKRLSKEEMGRVLGNIDKFIVTAEKSIRRIDSYLHDLEIEITRTLANLRDSMDNISRFTRELTEDPSLLLRGRPEKKRRRR